MTAFDVSERRIWAGRAEAYAGSFGRVCAHAVPEVLDAAGVGVGSRLLDVGTGTGVVAEAACVRGARVVAVDAEPGMVAHAARKAPSADVRLGVLPQLPFDDDEFDSAVGNFVLNHVGRPREALAELRRVTRPGGAVVVTVWPVPAAAGQALWGRVVHAAGVERPAHLPALAAEDDFGRTEEGLAELLREAGLGAVRCRTLEWEHRAGRAEWWSGPASGVATIGQVVTSQSPETIAEIRRQYDALADEFATSDGQLALPHAALLAYGRA